MGWCTQDFPKNKSVVGGAFVTIQDFVNGPTFVDRLDYPTTNHSLPFMRPVGVLRGLLWSAECLSTKP